jgi:hypothetical protein
MSRFLTILDTYTDNNGVLRYNNVSWPVFRLVGNTYIIKDVDGTEFECEKSNALVTPVASKLSNLSDAEYVMARRTRPISDFNAFYKTLGVDQSKNTKAMHVGGELDPARKIELINERDYGQSEREYNGQENLFISD